MIKGTTKSGFKFNVDEKATDNMELIDALADLNGGDSLAMSRVCLLLIGPDQRQRLYDHLRNEDGIVPVLDVERELVEIIDHMNKGKKSSASPT